MNIDKKYIYIGVIIIIILFLIPKPFEVNYKKKDVIIDSVEVVKETLTKTGTFVNEQPKPIVVVVPSSNTSDVYLNSLLSELKTIKSENNKTKKLLEELALRVYEKKYEDSTVVITVRDSINGRLRNQYVNWKVKPQKVKFYETKTTEKLVPKFTVLAGGKLNTSTTFNTTNFELNLGFQNKNGDVFELGANTSNQVSLGFKKNILRKY